MEATYHLNPGELTDDFPKVMQLLFHDRRMKVTIKEVLTAIGEL